MEQQEEDDYHRYPPLYDDSTADIIPGLPPELALDCLARLPYTAHRAASAVCTRWRRLLRSSGFYNYRRRCGLLRPLACLVQLACGGGDKCKPAGDGVPAPAYQLSIFEAETGSWEKLDPPPGYPDGIPLFCHLSGWAGLLILIGGWHPLTYRPLPHVFVYDFAAALWRRGGDMPAARSFFAGACVEGKVYIAGGHDGEKNALRSAWVYDVAEERWGEVAAMGEERDECEGVVVEGGGEVVVVGGYCTERQGGFVGSAEVYEEREGRWRRVEGAWEEGRCARGAVAGWWRRRRRRKMLSGWEEWVPAARVGTAGVVLPDGALVAGSEYQGGPTGFYLVEGASGKVRRVEVSGDFIGPVQSCCCVQV